MPQPIATFILAACCGGSALASQVTWTHLSSLKSELPAPTGSNQQTACVVADFNADGRQDIVVASRLQRGRIEVWLTTDRGFDRRLVESANVRPEAGGTAHDIDGDGDLDLVLGQDSSGNELYWWENPSPNFGSTWRRRLIRRNAGTKHHDQRFGDVDGDGVAELVTWNQGTRELVLFEIPNNPRSAGAWSGTVIYRSPTPKFEGLALADVDRDGKLDIVAAGRWFRHRGGRRFDVQVVDASMAFTRAAAGQLVAGGRLELVFVPGDFNGKGYWYSWNGRGWDRHDLGPFWHGHTAAIADINLDGFDDILIGEMRLGRANCELTVRYGDGKGRFTKQRLSVGNGIHEGRLADVDGDGDLDIVHKPFSDRAPRLDVWLNGTRSPRLGPFGAHQLDAALPQRAVFVCSGDLDGDGDVDLVAGNSWYQNPGTASAAWTRRSVGGVFQNVACVHDFDGDGDLDLLGTQGKGAQANARFAWAENDGRAGFTVRTNIASGVGDFLQGVQVARFRGPRGPLEVALSWHSATGVQMLTVPSSPKRQTWRWRRVSSTKLGEDLSKGDIDGDGVLDLLLGTVWLEGPSFVPHTLGAVKDLRGVGGVPQPDRNDLADIDGDGDLDAVVGLEDGRDIVWFENPRPNGNVRARWRRSILATVEGQGFSMDTADLDGDGDVDVVVGEHRGRTTNRVIALLNDGTRSNWPLRVLDRQPATTIDHHDGTQIRDMDGDGDLDVISIGWNRPKLWWFENRAPAAGKRRLRAPTVTPGSGVFRSHRFVSLASSTPGAIVRFTLDGSEPTAASAKYVAPLWIEGLRTLKAKAFAVGRAPSPVAVAHYAQITDDHAYWRFDAGGNGARDDSAHAWVAKLVGTTFGPSPFGRSVQFTSPAARIELPDLRLAGSSALSIAAWVRIRSFRSLPKRDSRIISDAVGLREQDHSWMLSTLRVGTDTRLRFRLRTRGTTKTLVASRGAVSLGRWFHAVATWDGSAMRLYLDGNLVGIRSASGRLDAIANARISLGNAPVVGGRPLHGALDEVRIFRRALRVPEILALARDRPIAGVTHFGYASRACGGEIRLEAPRPPVAGDPWFGLSAAELPAGARGFLLVGTTPLRSGLRFGGVDFFLIPTPGLGEALPWVADNLGVARRSVPLVGVAPGQTLYFQGLWFTQPGCPTSRISASEAARIDVGQRR